MPLRRLVAIYMDSWAFSVLMIVYSALIGHGSPTYKDLDWKIVTDWERQVDGSYLFSIESNSINQLCRSNPEANLIFPTANLSINNIYVDGRLLQTNSPTGNWKLSQVFFKPYLHCSQLFGAKVVRQDIRSYIRFTGVVDGFPKVMKSSFGFYFLNSDLFFIASLIVILFTVINSVLILASGSINKFKFGLLQDISILAVLLCYSPGKFFEISMVFTNQVFFPLLLLACFLFGHFANLITVRRFLLFVMCLVCLLYVTYGKKNMVQLSSLALFPAVILWLTYVCFKFFKNSYAIKQDRITYFIQLFIMALIVIFAIYDGIASNLMFNSFVLLPIAYVLVSLVNYLDIIRVVGLQKYNNLALQMQVNQYITANENLTGKNEKFQEIIHDIKSPLTGLNFLLHGADLKQIERFKAVRDRLTELLDRSELALFESSAKWIECSVFFELISDICSEYSSKLEINIHNRIDDNSKILIYFEYTSLKSIFAEILDNSIKSNVISIEINISCERTLKCTFKNMRKDIHPEIMKVVSTGRGLKIIEKRISSWSGHFELDKNFDLIIQLKIKESNNDY